MRDEASDEVSESVNHGVSDESSDTPDPVARRRRGAELEDAICRAAFDELETCGYGALTIESVAARAQTGKGSIYRRWPSKDELLLDAFARGIPKPVGGPVADELADDVSTRDAALGLMQSMVHNARGRKRTAMHAMASEAARDPDFAQALDRIALTPRRNGIADVFRRGVGRGEVGADAPIDTIAELVLAFYFNRLVFRYAAVTDADIVHFVDAVVLPLLAGPEPAGPEPAGPEPAGPEQAGPEPARSESAGEEQLSHS